MLIKIKKIAIITFIFISGCINLNGQKDKSSYPENDEDELSLSALADATTKDNDEYPEMCIQGIDLGDELNTGRTLTIPAETTGAVGRVVTVDVDDYLRCCEFGDETVCYIYYYREVEQEAYPIISGKIWVREAEGVTPEELSDALVEVGVTLRLDLGRDEFYFHHAEYDSDILPDDLAHILHEIPELKFAAFVLESIEPGKEITFERYFSIKFKQENSHDIAVSLIDAAGLELMFIRDTYLGHPQVLASVKCNNCIDNFQTMEILAIFQNSSVVEYATPIYDALPVLVR